MGKIGAYLLSAVGVIVLVLALKPVRNNDLARKILPFLSIIPWYLLAGVGVVCLAFGLVLFRFSGGSKQPPEVPIYEGKNIVGYRRMKKKR